MLNKVQLIGRLGKKPELFSGKMNVTKFSLATSEHWTDKSGAKQEKVEWHNIVCFDKLADLAHQYLDKGSLIYLEGKIQTNEWLDKENNKRWTTTIVPSVLKFLSAKNNSENKTEYKKPEYKSNESSSSYPFADELTMSLDDIPF